ncbi:MAG: extracellular solute-binding protein [Burkholderiaceae bacterium]|nr:extracellular solute-binding protein [Burkholderiaceae bacterium]
MTKLPALLPGTERSFAQRSARARRSLAFALALAGAGVAGTTGLSATAQAQDKVLNLYSARHYQTDEALYANFTRQTGIKINRIEAGDEALLERLRSEGRNSPADVVLLVDAARLWKAQIEGLFQPLRSPVLEARIPAHLRSKDDGKGSEWFAFSTRARVILYNKALIKAGSVKSYQDLADPALKGQVCTRSGTHPYMLSLIGAMSEHLGEAGAEKWARGVVANFARSPRGGDTDQIKAVASGECGVALSNTYYLARLMRSDKPQDRDMMSKISIVMPDQEGHGTHINVSGGALSRYAPNREAATRFLEYLASDEAQRYFADGNNEWPAVPTVVVRNTALESLGKFKQDTLPISDIGRAQVNAARIIDRAGWR